MLVMKGGGGCRVISCGWGMPLVWLAKYFMSKKSSYLFLADNRFGGMKDLQLFHWRQAFYHPSFRHSHNNISSSFD